MTVVQPILAFGFVTPAFFAAGLALVGIPILIHILNRRRYKTVSWAAMEFLLRAMKKNRRRLKFEQWLLLATRCLLLFLAATALARPFGCSQQTIASIAGSRSGLHVFVIDNSYSMGYEADRPDARTHLDQAKRLAKGLIDRLSSGGEAVAIVTAGRPAQAVISAPSYDLNAAKSAIDRIEQTAGGTDLSGALQKAIEIGKVETTQPRKYVYLFTDATRSAFGFEKPGEADAIEKAAVELASVYRVTHFSLGKQNQWNHAVLDLTPSVNLLTSRSDATFAADVKGFGTGPDAQLQWKVDDVPLTGGGTLKLDADTKAQLQSNLPRAGGLHVISANLITDDRLKVDNARTRVFDVVSELKVLIVEGERGINRLAGSGAFLDLALAPPAEAAENGARTNSYVATELISDLELGNKVLGDYRAVILAGVGQIQPNQAQQLEHFVRQGGTLMLFMGEQVSGDNYNATLLPRGLLPGPMTKRVSVTGARGYTFDFNPRVEPHRLLREFREQEQSGLNTAQVFTYWQVDPKADGKVERVLDYIAPPEAATTEKSQKDPAITLHELGEGRVLFYSTTANAEWTGFPAKPAYVALMHELLAGSVNSSEGWLNRTVGEPLQVPPWLRLTGTPTLHDPAKQEVVIDQSTPPGGTPAYKSRPLAKPGVYTLSTGTRTMPVSVNVPSDEADIRTIDRAAIKNALGDIDVALESDQLPAETVSADAGNDYGWSVMAIVLALVAVECFMAMRFGHYRR
ncbi:MAG: BatA domain-containing protein [Tepidisphaeraceae bacterium]